MMERLRENLSSVQQRIGDAAKRSGRQPDSVRLVGVTKYVGAAIIAALAEAGCRELGENRPQSLWEKAAELNESKINWHLIGHLQRNKVKRTVEIVTLIHSVDSLRLLDAINEAGTELDQAVHVLLEVNVSGESAKHGFEAGQLDSVIEHASGLSNLQVDGLMCMAGLEGDQDDARREFNSLRELADRLRSNAPGNVNLRELSMGMSGDFELAIESGATLVRVGSLLFDGIG